MPNTFEVIEVMSVPGRKDMLAVLKVIAGDVYAVSGMLSSPQVVGQWRITSVLPSALATRDLSRVAVGLDGALGLAPGMLLGDEG